MHRIFLFIIFCLLYNVVVAQVKPAEGDLLNYRLVGFTIPKAKKAIKYHFEVSVYTIKDGKEILSDTISKVSDTNSCVMLLPEFGKQYAWRVKYINHKGKVTGISDYYHFSTGKNNFIDTAQYRLFVIDSAKHHEDMYVILDYIPVIYDMKGNAVWYMPDIKNLPDIGAQMRDIKPNKKFQTFTALASNEAFEFDYNGKILWWGPNDGRVSGDTTENYHHEIIKLNNGNIMVASHEFQMRKVPVGTKIDSSKYIDIEKNGADPDAINYQKRKDGYYKRLILNNLIEYNPVNNEIAWTWKAVDHFDDKDFFLAYSRGMIMDMHLNAFYFDTAESVIYMSFRNIHEVVKIDYPSGKVLKRYGHIWNDSNTHTDKMLFYGQHCVQKTHDNQIAVFNNNVEGKRMRGTDSMSEPLESFVCMYKEINTPTGLEPTWKFSCNIDTFTEQGTGVGGSVAPIKDGCLLVCMGGAGRVFIVDRNKKIIWNAVPQTKDPEGKWYVSAQYRAFFLTKKEIEKFIFN